VTRPAGHRSNEPVHVVEYDPEWPGQFERLRERLAAALGELAVAIEHVGSTAVPGLAAKPILDADVIVAKRDDVAAAVERLEAIGYRHQGVLGIEGREAFDWPPGEDRHHVYVLAAGTAELERHLRFRDRLRVDPIAARAYAELKRDLALRHPTDRIAYGDGKSEFVERILSSRP
jgi:GrpB-like predicted nucleotidyltransferase (UPF0157 family)